MSHSGVATEDADSFNLAITLRQADEIVHLIDHSFIPVDFVSSTSDTALIVLSKIGDLSGVSVILAHGANVAYVNARGINALMAAAGSGHARIVEKLLNETNIDVFLRDNKGNTALDWARKCHRKSCADLLTRHISIFLRSNQHHLENATNDLTELNESASSAILSLLKSNNLQGILSLVRQTAPLLDRSKPPPLPSRFSTPVSSEPINRNPEPLFYLDVQWKGMTPLMQAAGGNDADLVHALVSAGADVDAMSNIGHTPLTYACACGSISAVVALIHENADITIKTTRQKRTALLHASAGKHIEIVSLLCDRSKELAMQNWRELHKSINVDQHDHERILSLKDWSDMLHEMLHVTDADGHSALNFGMREAMQQQIDRIALRRKAIELAKSGDLDVMCSLGCGHKGKKDSMYNHEHRECPRRLAECPLSCGNQMGIATISSHVDNVCPNRLLSCRNTHLGCKVKLKANEKEEHEASLCPKRDAKCRLGCGESFKYDQLAEHEIEHCGLRVTKCLLGCSKYVKYRAMAQHVKLECVHRLLKCKVGCGEKVQAKLLDHHHAEVCIRPCVHNCGESIGPEEKRNIHERFICDLRPVNCPNKCSHELTARDLKIHQCPREHVDCPLGCSINLLERQHVDHHVSSECPMRETHCPYDLCGRKVTKPDGTIGYIVSYNPELQQHNVRIGKEIESLDVTNLKMNTSNTKCQRIQVRQRADHIMSSTCVFQKTKCKCGQILQVFQTRDHQCIMRSITCKCGQQMRADRIDQHKCPEEIVECACKQLVKSGDMPRHRKEECRKRLRRCGNGCGKQLPIDVLDHHEINTCGKRTLECSHNSCNVQVWAHDLELHEASCEFRPIECPLKCGEIFTAGSASLHICPNAPIVCSCGESGDHLCEKRLRRCPAGCGAMVKNDELNLHETTHCPRRFVRCSTGCGQIVRLSTHLCPCRITKCSCKVLVKMNEMADHLIECPNREIPCGALSQACKRRLSSWFAGDRLVHCDTHQDSVMTTACAKGDIDLLQFIIRKVCPDVLSTSPSRSSLTQWQSLVNHENTRGHTALTLACKCHHENIVHVLLSNGAHVNHETSRGYTALLEGIRIGSFSLVKTLLKYQATVTLVNRHGVTAVALARRLGNEELAQFMHREAEFQREQGELYAAITLNNYERIEEIVSHGDIHQPLALQKLGNRITELEEELVALEEEISGLQGQLQGVKTDYETKVTALNDVEDKMRKILRETEKLRKQCVDMNAEEREVSKEAEHAVGFLRGRDFKTLCDIREPEIEMESVVKAVCLVFNLSPSWTVAREKLFSNSRFKHNLIDLLKHPRIMSDELMENLIKNLPSELPELYPIVGALDLWVRAIVNNSRIQKLKEPLEARIKVIASNLIATEGNQRVAKKALALTERKYLDINEPLEDALSAKSNAETELNVSRKKSHVMRLLSLTCDNGHTPLSWAATYGNINVVALLLDKGSPVEYSDEQLHAAAKVVQELWKFHVNRKKSNQNGKPLTSSISNDKEEETPSKNTDTERDSTGALIDEDEIENDEKSKPKAINYFVFMMSFTMTLKRYKAVCRKARSPLAQAIYNGNIECVKELVKSGAHLHRTHDVSPMAPPPFAHSDEEGTGTIVDLAEEGLRCLGCCSFTYGVGWQRFDKHKTMNDYIAELWAFAQEKKSNAVEAVLSRRAIRREKGEQDTLNLELSRCCLNNEWEAVTELLDRGVSADHQFSVGYTLLTFAAFIGAKIPGLEGEPVLLVTALLERRSNIPNVNRQNGFGKRALDEASAAGRVEVMASLLDRGAEVNSRSKGNKTALIHASIAGKVDAVRLLLERGADVSCVDDQGMTAKCWAKKMNFTGVQRLFALQDAQNLGRLVVNRSGVAHREDMCSWGCGTPVSILTRTVHETEECSKRIVQCPLGCSQNDIWADELETVHLAHECTHRIVRCPLDCTDKVRSFELENHVANGCPKRQVKCLECDEFIVFKDMQTHLNEACKMKLLDCEYKCNEQIPRHLYKDHIRKRCSERIARCRNHKCTMEMKAKFRPHHEQNACEHRIIPCRYNCSNPVTWKNMVLHEQNSCPLRPVACPNRCKDNTVTASGLDEHLKTTCTNGFIPCTLGCKMKLRRGEMALHIRESCGNRTIQCPHKCNEEMLAKRLTLHERTCLYKPVICGLGCGEFHPRVDMPAHRSDKCVKRLLICRHAMCSKKLPADQLQEHEKYECKQRNAYCRLGCRMIMPARLLNKHEKHHCKLRMFACACGEQLREEDRLVHCTKQCVRK